MKNTLLLLYFLLAAAFARGQIALPTFTTYTSCPAGPGQMNVCPGWRQPTGGTSDYFNACAPPLWVGVPLNALGYQDSPDSAYAGLINYAPESVNDYKEYIAASFAPLTVGKAYTFSVHVSLADNCFTATDGFGVLFTTFPYSDPIRLTTVPLTPQIDFSSYGVIADKINWVTLTGTFVADSAYTDLMFGCFKPYGTMMIDTLNDGGALLYAYYYFSQIQLADTADLHPPKDTTGFAFPNAFTPNADGDNDIFRIIGRLIYYDDYLLNVYNRFGQLVFTSRDPAFGWNGMFNGIPADVGVYFYMAQVTSKGKHELVKGDLTLLR